MGCQYCRKHSTVSISSDVLVNFIFFAKAKVLILFSTPVLYSALNVIACLEMSVTSFIENKCDKN